MAPESSTNSVLNLFALGVGLCGALVARYFFIVDHLNFAALLVCSVFASFFFLEFARGYGVAKSKNDIFSAKFSWSFKRIAFKFAGLLFVFGAAAFIYFVVPEYEKPLYQPFFEFLSLYWTFLSVVALVYVLCIDGFSKEVDDNYSAIGKMVFGINRIELRPHIQFALGWLVKIFFLPMMFGFLYEHLGFLLHNPWRLDFQYIKSALFGVDVLICTVGYIMTSKMLGTHIRSVEPSCLGWFSALACYPPLNGAVLASWLGYRDYFSAYSWTTGFPLLGLCIDSISLLLLIVYVAATVSLGARFSNLTNRGIVTGGVYKYLKHPAYLSKNIFWWIELIKFFPGNLVDAMTATILMAGVSGVYWVRAMTEERHLSSDCQYVYYVKWLNEHGLFARVRSVVRV